MLKTQILSDDTVYSGI